MAKGFIGGLEVAACYLGGRKVDAGFLGNSANCIKPARFQMRVSAPSTPTYGVLGSGVLTTVDHGNGTYTITSDGSIEELISSSRNETSVAIDSALDLVSVSAVSFGGKGAWEGVTSLVSFDTTGMTEVYDCSMAWSGCTNLVNFNSSGLTGVQYLDYAWWYCRKLESFDGAAFRGGNVLSFQDAWGSCGNLKCISELNTTGASYKMNMFSGCSDLIAPDATVISKLVSAAGFNYHNPSPCP